jgi:hypothetical protein
MLSLRKAREGIKILHKLVWCPEKLSITFAVYTQQLCLLVRCRTSFKIFEVLCADTLNAPMAAGS